MSDQFCLWCTSSRCTCLTPPALVGHKHAEHVSHRDRFSDETVRQLLHDYDLHDRVYGAPYTPGTPSTPSIYDLRPRGADLGSLEPGRAVEYGSYDSDRVHDR